MPTKFTSPFHSDFTGQRKPHDQTWCQSDRKKRGKKYFQITLKSMVTESTCIARDHFRDIPRLSRRLYKSHGQQKAVSVRQTSLYCVLQTLFFLQTEACGNCVWSRSIGTFFKQRLLTLYFCLTLVIFAIFETFSLLLFLLWWYVNNDLWCDHCKMMMTRWGLRKWLAVF